MKRTDFAAIACSIARSAAIIGDEWALLVLRDVTLGLRRFDELQRDLGVATNVLTDRLERLTRAGVLRRDLYQQHPARFEYALTDKGSELVPILLALTEWGDRWEAGEAGPPLTIRHQTCGQRSHAVVTCDACGEPLTQDTVTYRPGPGGRTAPGTALIAGQLRG